MRSSTATMSRFAGGVNRVRSRCWRAGAVLGIAVGVGLLGMTPPCIGMFPARRDRDAVQIMGMSGSLYNTGP